MLDINYIRENQDKIKEAIKGKKIDLNLDQLLKVDEKRREWISKIEDLQRQRNEISDKVGKAADTQERQILIEQAQKIKEQLEGLEPSLRDIKQEFERLMVKVPTVPAEDTPPGDSEADNVEVFKSGELPKFNFKPLDHVELAKKLDIIDFDRGAKVAGYRGYYLKNEGAILVSALMLYALKKMTEHGFKPMIPPTLVKEFALLGTGYFKGNEYNSETDEIYQVATNDKEASGEDSSDKKFLVGTAEPSLLAYFSGETLKEEDLPIKVAGYSQCYRSEIGSYGKDTKGLYRVHEFMKVEQVVLAPADIEIADNLQQEMLNITKEMHQELGLPYRVIRIVLGDLSAGKYKQFDIEAWLPGSERWAETGSASDFLDWQSRRLDVKYQAKDGTRKYVYMLNNTAMPSPRPLIAILENNQREDGSVKIPEVLVPYTGFSEITPKE
jgi:seryl-tRNA synthetase